MVVFEDKERTGVSKYEVAELLTKKISHGLTIYQYFCEAKCLVKTLQKTESVIKDQTSLTFILS